jgi:hypothetical protein
MPFGPKFMLSMSFLPFLIYILRKSLVISPLKCRIASFSLKVALALKL